MNVRKFGSAGPTVSEIGLGCWQLGGDWGDVDEYTAQKVIEAAVESGITFYDTADVYVTRSKHFARYKKNVVLFCARVYCCQVYNSP